jgi:hypothetical protein
MIRRLSCEFIVDRRHCEGDSDVLIRNFVMKERLNKVFYRQQQEIGKNYRLVSLIREG